MKIQLFSKRKNFFAHQFLWIKFYKEIKYSKERNKPTRQPLKCITLFIHSRIVELFRRLKRICFKPFSERGYGFRYKYKNTTTFNRKEQARSIGNRSCGVNATYRVGFCALFEPIPV